MSQEKKSFNVVVLGEPGVGKSSLVRRYVLGTFLSRTTTTVGVNRVPVCVNINKETFDFNILDTAGCFGFHGLIKSYMPNVDAVIFVYDLTNKETFASLPLWNSIIKNSGKQGITKVLVGNKKDLSEHREVLFKNAKNYAEFEGMVAIEISVKEEDGVDLVFDCVARELQLSKQTTNMENHIRKNTFQITETLDHLNIKSCTKKVSSLQNLAI
ncbi:ras-related protein Rab-31 isoform X2 [Hydra vulgaris]|uniref:Ras-related protein Rab-31 isoform X2 n=1 Tax=Hydra vulgaris TaxID=6087 RepID=A0ABM4DM58_HYDVU